MPKVLSYGSLNIDYVYRVPHIVFEGETLSSTSLTKSAGGKGANQSAALAKAGVEVCHAGRIGADGLFLVDLLKSYGVDTGFIDTGSEATGNAIIQVDADGKNCIILFPGGNKEIKREDIDAVMSNFSEGDWLVVQNETSNVDYMIETAKEKGMHVCFNPSPFEEKIFSFPLESVDLIIVNELEGAALARMDAGKDYDAILESLVEAYPESGIIMTVGADGALYGYKDKREKGEIVDLPVKDTTAAGDTFTGYYLASILSGLSVHEALQKACLASSLAVSREGAMQSIPTRDEVF